MGFAEKCGAEPGEIGRGKGPRLSCAGLKALQKLAQKTTQPRDIPSKKDLEPAPRRVFQHSIVSGSSTPCGRSRDDFLIDVHQVPSSARQPRGLTISRDIALIFFQREASGGGRQLTCTSIAVGTD